jgi:hypothetical protein
MRRHRPLSYETKYVYIHKQTFVFTDIMAALLQRIDYKIRLKDKSTISGGVKEMSEPKYTPDFIAEMEEIIAGEHIRIPDNMSLLEYILSLPDDEDDE